MGGDQHPPEEQRRTFEAPPPGNIGLSVEHDNEMACQDGFQIPDAEGTPPHNLYIVSASDQDPRDEEKKVPDATNCVEESPRGVLDGDSRCLDSETETSKESTSYPGTNISCRIPAHWKSLFQMLKKKSFRRLATFSAITVLKFRRSQRSPEVAEIFHREFDSEFSLFKPSWKNFSISELRKATNNFHPDNVIGKGGYAEVFRGCLADGQIVAIKRLICGTSEEQTINFLSELGIIVHIDHPNTAKLIGFSVEGGMHLILKLSPHGNLACHLHESKNGMEWSTRYKVAIGTAQGLEYLHEKCPRRIIHRDIKASNILLTEDFEAQICDFGLAKWLPDQWSHHTISTFAGTFGYLAPEYVSHGLVYEKTDIFAFGVLLLELITGRRAVSSSRQSLVMWAAPLLEKNDIKNLFDPSISGSFDHAQMNHTVLAASHCIKYLPSSRPKISEVLKILRGEVGKKNQQRKVLQRTFSVEIFDAEEYNATKYLNDLKRHRQVALEL